MKPITENITQPANTDVRQHVTADMMESLQCLKISINHFKSFKKETVEDRLCLSIARSLWALNWVASHRLQCFLTE